MSNSHVSISIDSLPNEILFGILSLFSTRNLLPLTTTSHRIHDVILCIIHQRLLAAASMTDRQVILECYHPSAKFSTPYYNCEYHHTDPFSEDYNTTTSPKCGSLGQLRNLYSHYKPIQPEDDRKIWTPRPTGGWLQATISDVMGPRDGLVSQSVDLESYELFSQLQSVVNIVKPGPKNGYFASSTKISEGLLRVWRDWLAARAKNLAASKDEDEEPRKEHEKRLLWSSVKEDIGIRLHVVEREESLAAPPPRGRYEDRDVGYTLKYEELVVRTSTLLLKLEASLERERNHEGKAIVIVS